MSLVLSGTGRVVRSGTGDSSYQEPNCLITCGNRSANPPPSNHANREESCGFLLTPRAVTDLTGALRLARASKAMAARLVCGCRTITLGRALTVEGASVRGASALPVGDSFSAIAMLPGEPA